MGLEGYPMKFSLALTGPSRYSFSFAFVGTARYTGAKVLTFVAANARHCGTSKKEGVERSEGNDDANGEEEEEKMEETEEMLTVGLREASLRTLGPGVYATR